MSSSSSSSSLPLSSSSSLPLSSAYDTCVASYGGGVDGEGGAATATTGQILSCISTVLRNETLLVEETVTSLAAGLDIFFLIFAASIMFFMQAGFAMVCAGCVRPKNIQNTLLKNLLDSCGSAIAFFCVGYAFAYGGTTPTGLPTTFIGNANFFLMGTEEYAFWLYQYAFSASAATIIAGTLAERCQMIAYLYYSIVLSGIVYPVVAHAVWSNNGFFAATKITPLWGTGMIDYAGSGVVHFTGGWTALIASKILGPRKDRFVDEKGNPTIDRKIEGQSVSMQCLGTFILWFGWYGFNSGSILFISTKTYGRIAALAAVNTTLGAASGGLVGFLTSALASRRRTGEVSYELSTVMNGSLSGLVGITAGCGIMEPWAGILVGSISGVLYHITSNLLIKFRIDDAVDAIPVHLANGIWGVISVGLFASPRYLNDVYGLTEHVGWVYSWTRQSSDARLLGTNCVGLLFICAWVFVTMTPFFLILSYLGWFRADPLEEILGLDAAYMGGSDGTSDAIGPNHLRLLQEKLAVRGAQAGAGAGAGAGGGGGSGARGEGVGGIVTGSEEEEEEDDDDISGQDFRDA